MVRRFEKFSYFITELSRLLHKIEAEEMEAIDLKAQHAIYLITISKFEEGITAANLAQYCGRDKADVSRSLRVLEAKGLIAKNTETKSNYRARIALTNEGFLAANKLHERVRSAVEYVSRGVSDEDRETLYSTLEIINNNIRDLSKIGISQITENKKM